MAWVPYICNLKTSTKGKLTLAWQPKADVQSRLLSGDLGAPFLFELVLFGVLYLLCRAQTPFAVLTIVQILHSTGRHHLSRAISL